MARNSAKSCCWSRSFSLISSTADELHLSKVDAIVQLRPQFHHLDAIVDGERHSSRIQREAENPAPESEARAVNMTVKSSEDDELDMSVMAKSLKAIQAEPWQRLQYVDEEVLIIQSPSRLVRLMKTP